MQAQTTKVADTSYAYAPLADAHINYLFPSPVMHLDWPESDTFNARLKQIILNKRIHSAGVVKTNRGGWQSETNLQEWDLPEIEELLSRIRQLVLEYLARTHSLRDKRFQTGWVFRAWANVNQKGHFNRAHDHLGKHSFISGIYYVDIGEIGSQKEAGGRTVFEDWSHVPMSVLDNPDPLHSDFKMSPKNGRMVLFPASLMHSVETYEGSSPRITIAFNLYHPGLAVSRYERYEQSASWIWTNFRGVMVLKRKVPEKLVGLGLIPRMMLTTPIPAPYSLHNLRSYLLNSVSHAFALASERFEARGKT